MVCGVDDSDGARSAAAVAERLAAGLGAELVLVHVSRDPAFTPAQLAGQLPAVRESLADNEERFVARVAAAAGVADYRWSRVEARHPADGLLAAARSEQAKLLVLGSRLRGPLATALLGSTSDRLVRSADCPVVVVPAGSERMAGGAAHGGPLLCGIDGSDAALAAAAAAGDLARRLGRRAILAHVCQVAAPVGTAVDVRSPRGVSLDFDALLEGERRAGMLRLRSAATSAGPGANVETRLEIGDPAERLIDIARSEDAALVVVATRGLGPLRSAVVGSVSRRLIDEAGRPVVIVPPAAADRRRDARAG